MTGEEVAAARQKLGSMWGVGRPLARSELARALGLSPTNGNDHVLNMENGKSAVSGTISILLTMYLAGSVPLDTIEIFRERGPRRRMSETGTMPPPVPRKPRKRPTA